MSQENAGQLTAAPEPSELGGLERMLEAVGTALAERTWKPLEAWANLHREAPEFWLDLGLLSAALLLTWILTLALRRTRKEGKFGWIHEWEDRVTPDDQFRPFPFVFLPVLWFAILGANGFGYAAPLLRLTALVATFAFCLRLPGRLTTGGKFGIRFFSAAIFVFAALHSTGFLDETASFLEARAILLGEVRISILSVTKGLLTLMTLFWLAAGRLGKLAHHRFHAAKELPPSIRVLMSKGTRVLLYTFAFLLTMGVMGIPITALAVFGGALGLGLGFGLQKVVSNLVSGVILLLDKSIKPGDVIEIEDTYGWINSLNMRHVSVITRDNKEHLIPNEDLITNRVVNWSYSSELVRIRAPIGVSYDSDLRRAMELAREAASRIERVKEDPPPKCLLRGFGDNAVDLELRFWIVDPSNGVGSVTSQVLLEVWDLYREHDIQFPFPQRDLHIKTGAESLQDILAPPKKKASRSSRGKGEAESG